MTIRRAPNPYDFLPVVPTFQLVSDDVADGMKMNSSHVFDGVGMDGGNLSPHLHWTGFPAETKSFLVTCYDPDAPTGSGFWHWIMVDLPATLTELERGVGSNSNLPGGAFHVQNDNGTSSYVGPSPPKGHGDHRYMFAVHALSCETLGVDRSSSAAYVGFNAGFKTLARAILLPVWGH